MEKEKFSHPPLAALKEDVAKLTINFRIFNFAQL